MLVCDHDERVTAVHVRRFLAESCRFTNIFHGFARTRRIYGTTVFSIGHGMAMFSGCFAD